MPKSKELVSSSSSGSDFDSEVEKKLKRKRGVVLEKPVKKQILVRWLESWHLPSRVATAEMIICFRLGR